MGKLFDTFKDEYRRVLPYSRLNRLRYFSCIGFSLVMLALGGGIVIGGSKLVGFPVEAWGTPYFSIGFFIFTCLWYWFTVRRLNDINISGLWILVPLGLYILSRMLPAFLPSENLFLIISGYASLAVKIILYITILFPGNSVENKFGHPSPKNNFFVYFFASLSFLVLLGSIITEIAKLI